MSAFQRELLSLVPVVRAYALIVAGRAGNADDLVQDTLEKAWRARDQYQDGTSMKAWLFTILRNNQHNERRKGFRIVEDPDGVRASELREEAGQGWRAEFSDVLEQVDKLDPESRQALLLVTAGLTYEEVAVVCSSPLRTVQSRVRRARARLAETIPLAAPVEADWAPPKRCVHGA